MPRSTTVESRLQHATSAPRLNVMPGNGLYSFSFSPGLSKGSFGTSENIPCGHWLFRNFVGGGNCGVVFPTTIVNPNKAVLTLDSSSRILTANDMSSLLLGHSEDELCGKMKLTDFIANPSTKQKLGSLASPCPPAETDSTETSIHTLPDPDILDNQGMVLFSGKVVNVDTFDNGTLPCSLWLKGLPHEEDEDQRWIAILEPVDITVAKASVDVTGRILKHDSSFSTLFGYAENDELNKFNVRELIPALEVPKSPREITKDIEKQQCTGQTVDCATFPLCAHFSYNKAQTDEVVKKIIFDLEIWVFSNISGLVMLDDSGKIIDYNYNFTRLLFGYGKNELEGKDITSLIPTFVDDVALIRKLNSPSFDSDSDSTISDNEEENQKENSKSVGVNNSQVKKSLPDKDVTIFISEPSSITTPDRSNVTTDSKLQGSLYTTTLNTFNSTGNSTGNAENSQNIIQTGKAMRDITNSMNVLNVSQQANTNQSSSPSIHSSPSKLRPSHDHSNTSNASFPKVQSGGCPNLLPEDVVTSTPAIERKKTQSRMDSIEEGSFFGVGKHKDGSDLVIIYQIRRIELNGRPHFCVWILRDPEEPGEGGKSHTNLTLASTFSETTEASLGNAIKAQAQKEVIDLEEDSDSSDDDVENSQTSTDGSSGAEYSLNHSRRGNRDTSSSCPDEGEELLVAGDFSKHYTVLRQIGKGAFGCVKMSVHNSDGLLVVTKFIKKSKVYQDSWVDDLLLRKRVPLEVSLLMTLDHPNIVCVFDMFENDDYFQLVMEKWGAGMDLFEFIDRNPLLDESLAAYIFRQIVSALTYLHSLSIIHRDVKDENVILNNKFHVKLIDFGSSAFTKPGKLFSQFAGTVEYCSPEVLKGNRYSGYELEVWSLGVTLYTLMYGENPFYDVDETIKGDLTFPVVHSHELCSLLTGMLEKDPRARMTMDEVAAHPWTQLECNLEEYVFHEVVRCSYDECHPKKYITEYSESDTSISTASNSFIYENTMQYTRRSLSFTPQGSQNDNDHVRMQRSATSISSSQLTLENSGEEVPVYDLSESAGASRTSSSQSASSMRSTITVDSSSFSCCSPSSESCESSESSTQLESTPSSTSATYYDNLSSTDTLSGHSSEDSINLSSALAKYCRLENSEDVADSNYENKRECSKLDSEDTECFSDSKSENTKEYDDSEYENIKDVINSDYEDALVSVEPDFENVKRMGDLGFVNAQIFDNSSAENTKDSDNSDLQKAMEDYSASSKKQSKIFDFREKINGENSGGNPLPDIDNAKDVEFDQLLDHQNEMDHTKLRHLWEGNSLEFEMKYMNSEPSEYEGDQWYDDVNLALPDPFDSWWDDLDLDSP
nr:PAS domain-containing serine/threonine-protein kinase-like isoform X2 [Procambarus clarkii]XP_045619157.1 PAS domain-containing serine/threonine-protein kinase-like isoform X2 [Procambarus clarkii]XP_045619158.1 PAS domain-containing serine/threonine-protein kinase-like isoform X2 [Procambarus clarkii]